MPADRVKIFICTSGVSRALMAAIAGGAERQPNVSMHVTTAERITT